MPELNWNVLCFASIDWDYNRQRPQWVMSSLAERGASVLYVDNLGLRMPRLQDARRIGRRLARWSRARTQRAGRVEPGIRRDAPIVPALLHVKPFRPVAKGVLLRRLRPKVGSSHPLVVWTYLPAPAIAEVARDLGADTLVYDWSDDAASHLLTRHERHRRRVAAWEDSMLARADVVFVASEELLRRRPSPNPNTIVVPHGVATFGSGTPAPPAVAAAARPRIGFVGTLSDWVDVGLLDSLAAARPDWSFVLLGPVRTRADGLLRRSNVVALGAGSHDQVGAVLGAIDVAVIPYRRLPAIEVASPVKLREYLAHGLPVVSTDLPEVRPFAPPVRIAHDAAGFAEAIVTALRQGPLPRHEPPSWADRVDEMIPHVERSLAQRR